MKWFDKVKTNSTFKFFSSVRLAVPLMLVLIAAVAVGTVIESRYNSDLARILLYHSWWFQGLLILLWINIFCATISRIPYKKHHTGFVITHIGLLTLLIGGLITANWGIDGQLRIVEKDADDVVVLPEIVLRVSDSGSALTQVFEIPRGTSRLDSRDFEKINSKLIGGLRLNSLLPFADVRQGMEKVGATGGVGVTFNIKSNFFDVTQALHSTDNPMLQMGPATFVIRSGSGPGLQRAATVLPKKITSAPTPSKKLESGESKLVVIDKKTNGVVKEILLSELKKKPLELPQVTVTLKRALQKAVVGDGGLRDEEKAQLNPALELLLSHQGQSLREVVFAKFPDFSMNNKDPFGLKFKYVASGLEETAAAPQGEGLPAGHPQVGDSAPDMGSSSGNRVEFWVNPEKPDSVKVVLSKGGKEAGTSELKAGETYQTPWMGMVLKIQDIGAGTRLVDKVEEIEPIPRMPLPPSAINVSTADDKTHEGNWIIEGDTKTVRSGDREWTVYYGRRMIQLPFSVYLDQFRKTDYPGTGTPMKYESDVRVLPAGVRATISMNEPLKHEGFTLYQSSFEMEPGRAPASIFSVNRDPGRPVKYIGSLILCLGIVIFTVHRSRRYQDWKKTT